MTGVGKGNGLDFTVSIYNQGTCVLHFDFGSTKDCEAKFDKHSDRLEVNFREPSTVDKDTKFMFHCSTCLITVYFINLINID